MCVSGGGWSVDSEDGKSKRHDYRGKKQSRLFLSGGGGSKWNISGGEFHNWTGFPRKSSLATVWKTSWRKAKLGGKEATWRLLQQLKKK